MPNNIAQSAVIDPSAILGVGVTVMENSIIRANVQIGDRSVIGPYCIIGEYQSNYYENTTVYRNPPTRIGSGAEIRSHSIIYSGTRLGEEFRSGHNMIIRENSSFGDCCLFGSFCQTDEEVRVGNYTRCHSRVFLASGMVIGEYSCLYPNVTTTDVRYPPYRKEVAAPEIGERVVVGADVTLLSGIKIGDDAFIAAGSLVSRNIPAGMFARGRPARSEKSVSEIGKEASKLSRIFPFDKEIIRKYKKNNHN